MSQVLTSCLMSLITTALTNHLTCLSTVSLTSQTSSTTCEKSLLKTTITTKENLKMQKLNQKLPAWFDGEVYTTGDTVANPFTGDTAELTPAELSMYDLIMGAQVLGAYDVMRKGLDWFRRENPTAFMVLLD